MSVVRTMIIAAVVTGCAGGSAGPASSTADTVPQSTAPTSTLPPIVECPGAGDFEEGGGIAKVDGEDSDSSTLGRISWEASDRCETFRFSFETSEGAPSTSVPDIRVDHLESFQVIRIAMDVDAAVVSDQLVETGLVDRLFVVRALEGGMFVDLHLAAPAAVRAHVETSPARLTLDLRPGFVEFKGVSALGDKVVLVSPLADSIVGQSARFSGYARTFEARVTLTAMRDGVVVSEVVTIGADPLQTWGEFSAELTLPRGAVSLFVGQADDEGGPGGVVIELLVN